jgi:hypothetical protein
LSLNAAIVSVYDPPWLLHFDFDVDSDSDSAVVCDRNPDPAFHSYADPDPAAQNDADPDPQHLPNLIKGTTQSSHFYPVGWFM